ncbi:MAG: endo-1,4-beta-xylanase [Salinivirgaceae bacterium]|nr:endo-1,4-beta-xylanase [Salinivirgaceae bacterium]
MRVKTTFLLLFMAGAMTGQAQNHPLNYNPNKFLGNITTMGQVRADFDQYWDQLTPENETKWESIERSPGVFDFTTARREYDYCKERGFKFKFHALLWGAQIPSYLQQLNAEETLVAITRWFDAVAKEFPDLEYIDVANEAVKGNNGNGNYHSPYQMTRIADALGGPGKSGYDWLAQAFIMARERWPKAVLIYNDYNTFQWDTDEYIKVINAIKAAGGPIDAAGCQSHDLNDMETAEEFKAALEKVHNGVQLPIFISEYDINKADDNTQLERYKAQFPVMWEADYVAGVTLWGYIFGQTWVDDGDVKGASGLIKNGVERPALKWLREYMLTDAAINAKSPLINVASDYAFISTLANTILIGDKTIIKGKASSANDEIAELRVYKGFNGDTSLYAKVDTSAVEFEWSTLEPGVYTFKMQALSSVSSTLFEKFCTVKACEPAKPFNGKPIVLPGKLEAENFDEGENTIAYSDSDEGNNGSSNEYRLETGVDIDKNDADGWVVGWTNSGEWIQYTVQVEKEQMMLWTARVASGTTGSAFSIRMGDTDLTGRINVPQTANNSWGTYTEIKGLTKVAMPAGTYNIRIMIEGSSCNIDYVTFETATGDEVFTEPYAGKPAAIPGTIEIEDYDKVKNGCVAETYKDNDSDNQGDANYRTSEGVDIVKGNGGKVIGYTNAGEWLTYTVNIEKAQKYYWYAVVSSGTTGAAFRLYLDDVDITGKVSIPQTGNNNWNNYVIVKGETLADLPAGTHTLKLVMEGSNGNIDKVLFSTESAIDEDRLINYESVAIDPGVSVDNDAADDNNGVFDVFSVMGVYRGTVEISNGDFSVLSGKFEKGLLILRNKATGVAKRVMVY